MNTDAFLCTRVKMAKGGLQEFYVNVGANGKFDWTLGPLSTPRLSHYFVESAIQLAEGQVAEVTLELEGWFKKIAERLQAGFVVTVDYGASAEDLYSSSDRYNVVLATLARCEVFRRHQIIEDILARPGEQDITTKVDWSSVKRVGGKLGLEVLEFDQLFTRSRGVWPGRCPLVRSTSSSRRVRDTLTGRAA